MNLRCRNALHGVRRFRYISGMKSFAPQAIMDLLLLRPQADLKFPFLPVTWAMRSSLLAAGLLASLTAAPIFLQAQTNAPDAGAGGEKHGHRMIEFLSPADQDRVINAYTKAIADNADLKSQEKALRKQRAEFEDANLAGRRNFREKVRTFQQKLRLAMLKEDPTLGPILDQIDKHRSEMRAKRHLEKAATS